LGHFSREKCVRRRLERTVVAAISSALTRETAPRDAGSDEPTLRAGVKRTAAIIVEVGGGDVDSVRRRAVS
jgi:hypothetical protein